MVLNEVLVNGLCTAAELLEPEGVIVRTPPPMVEMMTWLEASVAVMTCPLVREDDAEADVVCATNEVGAMVDDTGAEANDDDDDDRIDEADATLEDGCGVELVTTGSTELEVEPVTIVGIEVAT